MTFVEIHESNKFGLTLFTAAACTSTMDLAWQLFEAGRLPEWAGVLAERQSSGRGQFQRPWHSPPGNLYASLCVPQPPPAWCNLISLLAAEALRVVLSGLGLGATIKWPNDLLVAGKKVAGILIEERAGTVVAGVGLNLTSAPMDNRRDRSHAMSAGCLQEFGVALGPMEIWGRFVHEMRRNFLEKTAGGAPADFLHGLEAHLAFRGREIVLDAYNGAKACVVMLGLDSSGGIRVRTGEGQQRVFHSGSIYPAA